MFVDIAAPGTEVLSLRANGTDMYLGSKGYTPGERFVPPFDSNAQYYRATGTSMSAPHVSGLAALILSFNKQFTNGEIRQVLRVSVDDDILNSGFDHYLGAGRINATKALLIDSVPRLEITNPVHGAVLSRQDGSVVIMGSATGEDFQQYELFYGEGLLPKNWTPMGDSPVFMPIEEGGLGTWSMGDLPDGIYTLKLVVTLSSGFTFEVFVYVSLMQFPPNQITTSIKPQVLPAISRNKAVWVEYISDDSENDIFLYDFLTEANQKITLYFIDMWWTRPAISGDRIVWFERAFGKQDLYLYDLGPDGVFGTNDCDPNNPSRCEGKFQITTPPIIAEA